MVSDNNVELNSITPENAGDLLFMIKELAEFEKMPEQVEINPETLAKDIKNGTVYGFIAKSGATPVGMTLCYTAYSTWQGKFLHMEDLYVRPQFRRKGIGSLLWRAVGKFAQQRGMKRIQWNVLDWNKSAIKFYERVGF
uniref:N-acetyltransferase domain-containing protein n=1 Tax=Syphacia muris TaxID=451379 RepID=A0A0N5ADZ8_9BILA